MMTLITGQPGHNKTSYALTRGRKYREEGREVYAHGIKNLDYQRLGWHQLEDPKKWQDLPDGSVVILDECYDTFPNRNAGSKVPEHVEAMARHRHRGFDFILIAQQGLQLDPFLRGLYEEHIHVKYKWGKWRKLRRWSSYQGNVKTTCADVVDWAVPTEIFDYYTSTTLNTKKNHIPAWVKYAAVLAVLVLGVLFFVKSRYDGAVDQSRAEHENGAAAAPRYVERGAVAAGTTDATPVMTAYDFAKKFAPRFASMPMSAPAYDNRAVAASPEIFCAISHEGIAADGDYYPERCSCRTEQGTRYDLGDGECRAVALNGPPYNPYKQPQQPIAAGVQGFTPAAMDASLASAPAQDAATVIATAAASRGVQQYGTFRNESPSADPSDSGGW